jgi:hypothetical protein
MGRSHRRKWEGKSCVLCGGHRPAETWEHAPPIVIFRAKLRPKGLEAPACQRCNNGTSEFDQAVTFLALSQASQSVLTSKGLSEHELSLVKGTANNSPNLFAGARAVPVYDARPIES